MTDLGIADLARCDGVGRLTLERRIAELVALIGSFEARLEGRVGNADRTAGIHPDPAVRLAAFVRALAYRTVLADLHDLQRGLADHG